MTRSTDAHHDDVRDTPPDSRLERVYAAHALWVQASDAMIKNPDVIAATGADLIAAVLEAKQ